MLAAVEAGLPVVEYTPAEIKRAVVGYGRAEKHQVQQMVKLLLGLAALPTPHDAADALAVAICHVHSLAPVGVARRRRRVAQAATSWRHYQARTLVIAHLRGRILDKQPNRIVVDVNGVGYDVSVPLSRRSTVSATPAARSRCASTRTCARTRCLLLRVRDAARAGAVRAADRRQRHRSEARAGRAVGHRAGGTDHARSSASDLARLTAIPGVGKKTSERIVLELKDRLPRARWTHAAASGGVAEPSALQGRRALGADEPGVSSAARRKGRRRGRQGARRTAISSGR